MKNSSFLFLPLLLSLVVAAPQDSSICRQVPQNPAAGQIASQYLQIPGCGDGFNDGSEVKVASGAKSNSNSTSDYSSRPTSITSAKPQQSTTTASAKPQQSTSTASAKSQQTSTIPTAPGPGGGKCHAEFRNTVFNTAASRNAGWPQTTWDSLTANGVSNWSKSKSPSPRPIQPNIH